ncbi:MAG TPA: sialidase family protein, partial [Armatimonadota bacterium]|nr:sialidase family protein [Armatimonadota bacterium]
MLLLMGMAATAMAQPHQDDLALWLRAGKGVYVEEGRVAQWEDQSGRGNHATSSDGSGPTVRADAINGMPTVVFDGAKTRMTIEHAPELNAGEGFTVFCVFRYADGFRVAQKKSNSGGIVADGWFLSPAEGLGVSGKWGGGRSYRQNRWHVQTSLFDSVSGAIRIFSDGSEIKVTEGVAAQVPNDDPVYLGQRLNPGGTEGHLRGEIAELMICSAALTDEERRQTEEYLSVKYDLTPPVKPTMYITRVIPGHGTVDVEWLPHEGDVAGYIFEIKLRELAWEQADRAELPAEARSFSVAGLWDYADYTLRVLPVDATGEPIGQSAERIVAPGPVPGVVVDYLHREDEAFAEHGQYIGSPSITRLDDGRLIASHDLFGPGPQRFSRVFRSEDDGESWAWISDVAPAFWGKLFVHRGELYLLSTATEYGDLLLHHSPDGGDSWEPRIVIVSGTYHKAPMPIIEHQGKLWTCVELQTG